MNDNITKLYLPPIDSFKGGPKTFLTNLRKYIAKDPQIQLVDEDIDADVVLFPVEYPEERLKILKTKNIKIIQRLDGVFYPSKHTPEQVQFNLTMQKIYKEYADFIIFQSEYSKLQCFNVLGEKRDSEYKIIINGVDKDIFKKSDKSFDQSFVKFVATGNFRNEDMLKPIVESLDLLIDKYSFELSIIGNISNNSLNKYLEKKYIKHIPQQELSQLSRYLSDSDIFLYSFINPVCPNSVIEAISTGLPVVGLNSGAMQELLFFNKDLLAKVSDDLFQDVKAINPELFAEKIKLVIENYNEYKQKSLENSQLYSMEECAKEYSQIIKMVVSKRTKFNIFKIFR